MSIKFNNEMIRRLRKRAGLTTEELARRMSVSRQSVCMMEGGYSKPNMKTLEKLFEALDINDPTPFFIDSSNAQ